MTDVGEDDLRCERALAYLAAMAGGLPNGNWVARWGGVRVSQASLLFLMSGTWLACVGEPWCLLPSAVCIGFGYGLANPSATAVLARHVPAQASGLFGRRNSVQVPGFDKMFPTMSRDMMEMWFGKTFNREGLDAKTRLLVTIAALTVLGAQAEPQLKLAVRHALEAGATQREIAEVIWQMSMFGGLPAMQKALEIAQSVFAEVEEKDA